MPSPLENEAQLDRIIEQMERLATLEEKAKNLDTTFKSLEAKNDNLDHRLRKIEKRIIFIAGFIVAVQMLFPFILPKLGEVCVELIENLKD